MNILNDYRIWAAQQEERSITHSKRCHLWPRHEACMIHRLAAALDAAMRAGKESWIPMSERLPEEGEWVLWFNGSWSCPIAVAKRDGKLLDWGGDFCFTLHGFTHWMPLPEPPEVK